MTSRTCCITYSLRYSFPHQSLQKALVCLFNSRTAHFHRVFDIDSFDCILLDFILLLFCILPPSCFWRALCGKLLRPKWSNAFLLLEWVPRLVYFEWFSLFLCCTWFPFLYEFARILILILFKFTNTVQRLSFSATLLNQRLCLLVSHLWTNILSIVNIQRSCTPFSAYSERFATSNIKLRAVGLWLKQVIYGIIINL